MFEMTKINFGGEPSLKGAESVSVFDICPAYQVLAETVQAGVLYFPALLDDHEGEDTEKGCNLKPIRQWLVGQKVRSTSKLYLIASESPRGFPFNPFMRSSSKGGLKWVDC